MLGQYRILSEVLIFALGVAITSYVALSFSSVRDFIGSTSTQDKMNAAANNIMNSIARVTTDDSTLVIEIPEKISGKEYTIRIIQAGGEECKQAKPCFLNLTAADASIRRELFNINRDYNIKGEVHSSARFLSISKSGNEIILGRAR